MMLVAARYDGWGAVAIAPGEDLVMMDLYAPTERDLRRVWTSWLRMVRNARLFDPAPGPGPDWSPPDHL